MNAGLQLPVDRYQKMRSFLVLIAAVLAMNGPLLGDTAVKHLKRGDKFFGHGKWDGAIGEYRAALRSRPDFPEARARLGRALEAKGDLSDAISELRELVRLEPKEPWWRLELGIALELNQEKEAALKEYELAAQLAPEEPAFRLVYEGLRRDLEKGVTSPPFKPDKGVQAPIPIYKPEPPYSEKARQAKYQGTAVLLVDIDEQGNVANVRLFRPLRLGLDQKALETVRTWKFKPATRNGAPVGVRVMVEVNFRLF